MLVYEHLAFDALIFLVDEPAIILIATTFVLLRIAHQSLLRALLKNNLNWKLAAPSTENLFQSLFGLWVKLNWAELAHSQASCTCFFLCVHWACLYLNLRADILGR